MNFEWQPFFVSFQLGLWVTGILLVIAFPLALLFSKVRGRWALWVEPVITLPLVLSPTVLGFYFLMLFSPNSALGTFLESHLGIRLAFSFPGIVAASCVSGLPFMFSALKVGLAGIPISLLEASYTLGKGRVETFFRVTIPLMRTAIFAGTLTTFAHTLGEFGVVLMIGGSLPGVTKTVSIAIYEKVESLNFAEAQIDSLVLIAIGYLSLVAINHLQRSRKAA